MRAWPAVVLNRLIALDPGTQAALKTIEGKRLCLVVEEMPNPLYITITAQGLDLSTTPEARPHVTLRAPVASLVGMTLASGFMGLKGFSAGEVTIQGDLDLGRRFQDILKAYDPDIEEQVSRVVGDVAAHRLGRAARAARAFTARAGSRFLEDAAAWLKDERKLVPWPDEVRVFLSDVDRARDDVERLAARLARLERAAQAARGGHAR